MIRSAACLLAFVLCGAAADRADSRRAPRETSADTDPNSDFWRDAPHVIADRDTNADPVPGHRTEIRSLWTPANLYFLFICPFEELNLKPDPRADIETNQLWNWDVAEVFIGSDFQNIRRYKEFEISPRGEWVDLDIDLDAPRHQDGWKWNSGFQAAGRTDQAAKVWYGFMRIPYAAIDTRPAASGNTLRINFFRAQGTRPNHKAIVWQPTHRPSYHVPEAFGTLRLVD